MHVRSPEGRLPRAAVPQQPGAGEELDELRPAGELQLLRVELRDELQVGLHARLGERHLRGAARFALHGEAGQPVGEPAGGLQRHRAACRAEPQLVTAAAVDLCPTHPDVGAREVLARTAEGQQVPHQARRDRDAGPRADRHRRRLANLRPADSGDLLLAELLLRQPGLLRELAVRPYALPAACQHQRAAAACAPPAVELEQPRRP